MQFLITDGGPHPADKWAEVSANEIMALIVIPDDATSDAAVAARQAKRELFPKLVKELTEHHGALQKAERAACKKGAAKRSAEKIDVIDHMASGVECIIELMTYPPFREHFSRPDVRAVVARIIGQHATDIVHIERQTAAAKKDA